MKAPISMDEVESNTDAFLTRHWNEEAIGHPAPKWENRWTFDGPIPARERDGCYALLADGAVLYIGVGHSEAESQWKGEGLSKRLSSYWKKADKGEREYSPVPPWAERGLNEIRTNAFPPGTGYLAYALEAYLIGSLRPPHNTKIHRID